MVYMPSTPTTPSMMPLTISRTCSPADASSNLSPNIGYEYVPPNGALLPTYTQHQGWAPEGGACNDVYVNMFDMPSLDPLAIPPGSANADSLFKSPTGSYATSSGPSSPLTSPYTPTALETLHIGVDAWQAQTSLPMFDAMPQFPLSLEYQPYAWGTAPDLWVNGGAPMFNEDFDITMIPPISIEVPKFDGAATHIADQPCAQHDFLSPQSCEQESRAAYAPVFTFNDVPEIPLVDGF